MCVVRTRNTQAHLGPRTFVNGMAQGFDFHSAQDLNPNP